LLASRYPIWDRTGNVTDHHTAGLTSRRVAQLSIKERRVIPEVGERHLILCDQFL
jgi:hypothetical protein